MTDVVAVTGAEGFIGSHLVEALVRRGCRVRAMVLYNMWTSCAWLDTLERDIMDHVDVVFGDVRDPASARELVEGAQIVYHLAAIGSVPYSYRAPRSFVDNNSIGTLHILEAVRACHTPRMVHTSTSETYGTARTVPISESHPLQAQSPYAASKIAADKLVESYHLSFGVPAVTLRPFNTFGPRQSTRAVIPQIITQLATGARQLRLGALDPTRDFCYVTDTVQAFIELGEAPASAVLGEVFNCGPGDDVAIGKLAEEIAALMGVEADIVEDAQRLRPKESEVMRLVCDATKLRERTGWRPRPDQERGSAARPSTGSSSRLTWPASRPTSTTSELISRVSRHRSPTEVLMRVLIIGASSFLGGHVLREALATGHDAVTAGRSAVPASASHHQLDLSADSLLRIAAAISSIAPHAVINCAGATSGAPGRAGRGQHHSRPRAGHGDARSTKCGQAGPHRLGRRVRAQRAEGVPVTELAPPRPASAYGADQARRHQAGRAGPDGRPDAVMLRVFNVVGAGAPEDGLPGRAAVLLRQAIACGSDVRLGSLDAVRDFVDARDVAGAVLAAAAAAALPHPGHQRRQRPGCRPRPW